MVVEPNVGIAFDIMELNSIFILVAYKHTLCIFMPKLPIVNRGSQMCY
jgi:hypothetical protein